MAGAALAYGCARSPFVIARAAEREIRTATSIIVHLRALSESCDKLLRDKTNLSGELTL